ncbi:hypothetical protein H8356DRAFT_1724771 [Neocallimastix lanati (nom. inval.)]|jgi:hypothetical protein|uniref:Uncharacterized protein n=1 Tax=Neocallimastix californiae TaxID=1754190 RepID=A0A1Y2FFV7_9FUNG|nr:hypothetical protein H8356DRAFT_1724771 [Neocallimastix sp. JGI-2020a]ORY82809.1 hypothetical protein LY90DRAFT_697448 [Neocallimastix californiae]|eukprot:ORY82809.1 hypothetical protein LY90DRAFT_697448 [Neocallimastix californiae]
MKKVETQSSADLINNLLLNLDNLKIQNETNNVKISVDFSLQEQLDMLQKETQKLTNQYTQKNTTKSKKGKKIPPPIITGSYQKRNTKFQTIDDLLFELNNASMKVFGESQTPSTRSSKSRKGSFVDPRRFSDPYKYTILSTLDETVDGEEEEDSIYTLKTPMTALPYYGRKNNFNNMKVPVNTYISPKSAGTLRNRSYSQPERYTCSKTTLSESTSLKCNIEQSDRTSTKYIMKLHNSISNEKSNNQSFVKPPRSTSIGKSHAANLNTKRKGNMGLENKPSFQSDITLVNEE